VQSVTGGLGEQTAVGMRELVAVGKYRGAWVDCGGEFKELAYQPAAEGNWTSSLPGRRWREPGGARVQDCGVGNLQLACYEARILCFSAVPVSDTARIRDTARILPDTYPVRIC
jgi:hypothetical protein